jgi:TRAP-type mannitol/chloroaromatic compound transport system substrate-binding protein
MGKSKMKSSRKAVKKSVRSKAARKSVSRKSTKASRKKTVSKTKRRTSKSKKHLGEKMARRSNVRRSARRNTRRAPSRSRVGPSGSMSRRRFLGTAAVGAAGVAGAAMMGSGVAHAGSPGDDLKFAYRLDPNNLLDFDISLVDFETALGSVLGLKMDAGVKEGKATFGKVSDGTYDIGYGIGNEARDSDGIRTIIPQCELFFSIPFGFELSEHVSWYFEGGGRELQRELYAQYDVVPIPITWVCESGGTFLDEITIGNLTTGNWRLRWFGMGADVLDRAYGKSTYPNGLHFASAEGGSAPLAYFGDNINIPDPDTGPKDPNAMLHGFEYSSPKQDYQNMYRDWGPDGETDPPDYGRKDPELGNPAEAGGQYFYLSCWFQPVWVGELWINKSNVWDKLTQDQRDQIDIIARDTLMKCVARSQDQGYYLDLIEAAGLEIMEWPSEILKTLRAATIELLRERSKKSKGTKGPITYKVILDSMAEFARTNQVWWSASTVNRGTRFDWEDWDSIVNL